MGDIPGAGINAHKAKRGRVADVPDQLVLRRHRDLVGRERQPWTRRILLGLVVLLIVLAAANLFGQRPSTSTASVPSGSLEVYAPTTLRGGVFWMARFHVRARQELEHATIVLDPGWLEQMHLNTLEPAPIGEASRDGRIALDFGRVPAGQSLLVFAQFQVNPTNVGRHSHDVELHDGEKLLARVDRTVTIFP
jgi:hypothetical protein